MMFSPNMLGILYKLKFDKNSLIKKTLRETLAIGDFFQNIAKLDFNVFVRKYTR
jgi:hypothetical protein